MTIKREEERIDLRVLRNECLQEWGERTRGFSKEPEAHLCSSHTSAYLYQDKEAGFRFLLTPPSTSSQIVGLEFHPSWCINTRRKRKSNPAT